MPREICEACGRAVSLCTCVPSGSRQDTPCIEKTSEEIASEIVRRETSDSLDEERLREQRDSLLETLHQVHMLLTISKNLGHGSVDWDMLRDTVKKAINNNGGNA